MLKIIFVTNIAFATPHGTTVHLPADQVCSTGATLHSIGEVRYCSDLHISSSKVECRVHSSAYLSTFRYTDKEICTQYLEGECSAYKTVDLDLGQAHRLTYIDGELVSQEPLTVGRCK